MLDLSYQINQKLKTLIRCTDKQSICLTFFNLYPIFSKEIGKSIAATKDGHHGNITA